MLNWIRPRLLKFLRVPHDPTPPLGAPGSVKVFRAGRKFYFVGFARWIFTQIGAVVGIVFSLLFISHLRDEFEAIRNAPPPPPAAAAGANPAPAAAPTPPPPAETSAATKENPPTEKKSRRIRTRKDGEKRFHEAVRRYAPAWTMDAVAVLEFLAIAGFLASLPFTYAAVRLDWELRWYIVTDRSLRIRAGIWSLQESTMSFANIQQVEVRQGPLQRLLGISDLRVQSAGGGGGEMKGHQMEDSLHTGVFHGVDNAHEIRDLILDRLKKFRAAGLGDPEDHHAETAPAVTGVSAAEATTPVVHAPASATGTAHDALAAARDLLEEARALRRAVT